MHASQPHHNPAPPACGGAQNGTDVFAPYDTFADDLELGQAMVRLGVPILDLRDAEGRELYLGLGLDEERDVRRASDPGHWVFEYARDFREGYECCSNRWVATHYTGTRAVGPAHPHCPQRRRR